MSGGDRSTPEAAGKSDAKNRNVDQATAYLEHGKNGSTESIAEVQKYVQTLHASMNESDYRQFMDKVTNRVDDDARKGLVSNGTLPDLAINLNASDRQVDREGYKNDAAAQTDFRGMPQGTQQTKLDDNGHVISTTASDNSSGMSFDSKGNCVAFQKGDHNDVIVTSSLPDGSVQTFDHTDVNAASVKMDKDGNVTMDRLDSNKQKIGTVAIGPGGQETTQLDNGSKIVRDKSGADGKITHYEGTADGKPVSFDGTTLTGLPGLDAESQKKSGEGYPITFEHGNTTVHPGDFQLDPSTGKIASYVTNAGVTVSLNDKGQPTKYDSGAGYTFEIHDNKWCYHQDGSSWGMANDWVQINVPTLDAQTGEVKSKEHGGLNNGRDHQITANGQVTGSGAKWSQTFISGLTRNTIHAVIDDNVNTVLEPINGLFGTHLETHVAAPVDPNDAGGAELVGGGIGSTLGVFGLGKIKEVKDLLELGKKGAEHESENRNKSKDDMSDWKTWYKWWE